jgi:hypothetical protein
LLARCIVLRAGSRMILRFNDTEERTPMSLKHLRIKTKLKQVKSGLNLLDENDLAKLELALDAALDIIDDNDENEDDNH